jgi:TPR repeat protein
LAQNNLSLRYRTGVGTRPNLAAAVRWCRKSAISGHTTAQYNLGLSYLRGEGVSKSKRLAKTWLLKAASAGEKDAVEWLGRLDG